MRLVTISEQAARNLEDRIIAGGGWIILSGEELEGSVAVFQLMMDPTSVLRRRAIALIPDSIERLDSEAPLDRELLLAAIGADVSNCERLALKGSYDALDWADAWREWLSRASAIESP